MKMLDSGDFSNGRRLTDFPTELLFYIFDFVPLKDLYCSLRLLCRRFNNLLCTENYYKSRFSNKYITNKPNNPIFNIYGLTSERRSNEKVVSWTEIAVYSEIRTVLCEKGDFKQWTLNEPHTTTVDSVRLFDKARLCVSGGRDKLLCLWNLEDLTSGGITKPTAVKTSAQAGWIWEIASHEEDNFFTCGFDSTVKQWSIGRELESIRVFQTDRPVMHVSSTDGLLAAGLSTGNVVLFDLRSTSQKCYKAQKGIITGIKATNNLICTIGEDKRFSAYDIRSDKLIVQDYLNPSLRACPRCLSTFGDALYIGDSRGNLTLLDIGNNFKEVVCFNIGTNSSLNTIYSSIEGLVTGSSDGKVRFLSICEPFKLQKEFTWPGEITSLDFSRNMLVAGTTDSFKSMHVLQIKTSVS